MLTSQAYSLTWRLIDKTLSICAARCHWFGARSPNQARTSHWRSRRRAAEGGEMGGGSGRAQVRPVGVPVQAPLHVAERLKGVAQLGVGVAADRVALHAYRPSVADGTEGTEHGEVVQLALICGSIAAGRPPPLPVPSGRPPPGVGRRLRQWSALSATTPATSPR